METWLTGEDEFGAYEVWELSERVVDRYGDMEVNTQKFRVYVDVSKSGFRKALIADTKVWQPQPWVYVKTDFLDEQVHQRKWFETILPHRKESSNIKELYQKWTKVDV